MFGPIINPYTNFFLLLTQIINKNNLELSNQSKISISWSQKQYCINKEQWENLFFSHLKYDPHSKEITL